MVYAFNLSSQERQKYMDLTEFEANQGSMMKFCPKQHKTKQTESWNLTGFVFVVEKFC